MTKKNVSEGQENTSHRRDESQIIEQMQEFPQNID